MSARVDEQQKMVDDWNKKYHVGKKAVVTKDDRSEFGKNYYKFIGGLVFLLIFLWLVFIGILYGNL